MVETLLITNKWMKEGMKTLSAKSMSPRRFAACFGVPPLLAEEIWTLCYPGMLFERLKPTHMLTTLYWMKTYPTEDVAMTTLNIGSRNTLKKRIDLVLSVFEAYLPEIDWEHRLDYFLPQSGVFAGHTFCVDGTECEIQRPTEKHLEKKFWSGKAKKPTVKYEVTSQISTGLIIRVSKQYPGNVNDKTIFEQDGLCSLARECKEKGLADAGYMKDDLSDVLTVMESPNVRKRPLTKLEQLQNRCIAACRILTERTNGLIKNWNILDLAFRGSLGDHERLFNVACRLVNVRIRMFPLTQQPHRVLLDLPVVFDPPRGSDE